MIQFNNVCMEFAGDALFEEVSFILQKGERCGFVGRNGSGKSTLFRMITGQIEPTKGKIIVPKNYKIGHLEQHIHFTKSSILEEAILALPEGEESFIYKAEAILFGLGFTKEDMDKSPAEFSGGYHLRLHLAKVLLSEPDCLLLDEPTNYLDILSIRWLTQFLSKWQKEFILISHDREFMDKVSTHTLGIHRGKVKKMKGSSINFFEQILEEEELHEKALAKAEKKRAHLQSFIDRFGAKATKASQAQARKKALEREPILEKLGALFHLSFAFHEAPFPSQKMLEAKNLSFGYTEESLIKNFSIEILKGEKVAIIGKNGRGKSTLLKLLCHELKAKEGQITLSSNTKMGYFGQTHIDHLKGEETIFESIAHSNPHLTPTEVKGICGLMLFSGETSDKKIKMLSGGEKSRVLLGKIIARPCNLLLLDEPTHHLDIESIEALIDALEDFNGSIVIVTHSELILKRLQLDKIIVCEQGGQKVFPYTYEEFLEKAGWEEERGANNKEKKLDTRKEKTALLRPLQKQIQDCEKKIMALEEEEKKHHALLEKGGLSADALKEIGQKQKALEELNKELYRLYDLYAEAENRG